MLIIILLFLALIAFALATFNIGHPKINVVALGLALWVAATLVPLI